MVLLIFLSTLEELIVAMVHGESIAGAFGEFRHNALLPIIAKSLVVLLALLPYVALRRLARTMRPGELTLMLFGPRTIGLS